MAAIANFAGAFLGDAVAKTVGSDIIEAPTGTPGLVLIAGALLGAITWNLITWYFGLPSSSSHALIGGLVGAELAAILAEKAMLDLQAPVMRVTGYDVPYPYWQIEDAYMPSAERVADAARKLLEF